MSNFTLAQGKAPPKPAHVIVLSPTDFADDWHRRPSAEVAVGLRRVCDRDRQVAEAEATKYVREVYVREGKVIDQDVAVTEWNNIFMRWIVATATCDPNDVTRPYFEAAQDIIGSALTPEAILKLWNEYHRFVRRTDAGAPKATDEDLARLGRLIKAGRVSALKDGIQSEVRRLLAWSLSQLGPDDVDEEETDDGAYLVRAN